MFIVKLSNFIPALLLSSSFLLNNVLSFTKFTINPPQSRNTINITANLDTSFIIPSIDNISLKFKTILPNIPPTT